ncbi:MAG TPA: ABC transporter permease [Thermoanaerobaculia bacterium]|nr:ABC transporter permease [Thermoanaerobaculia bacterium]
MSILSWLKRRRLNEEDFQDEVQSHLAMAAKDRIAGGADPRSAELAARKEFGNVTLTTEAAREVWTPWWIDALHDQVSDIRFAVRSLAKNPGFTLTVIAVLTLGIGLNAAVFTMLKGLALTPLGGVDRSASLAVMVGETSTGRHLRVSYPDYEHIRENHRGFSELFGSSLVTVSLGKGRTARLVSGELVTGNYFQVMGVGAQLGRTLLPSDEIAPGKHPVIVVSDGLWRRDYEADPDIVGKTVEINGLPLTVVGVTDPEFHGTIVSYDVEVFIPVMMGPQIGLEGGLPKEAKADFLTDRRAEVLFPHGYLRPESSVASAAAEAQALWSALSRDRSLTDATMQMRVFPFSESPTGGQTFVLPTLMALSAMGLFVLLIACANIAGLVMVRGVSRQGEIAVRLALGASRTRIIRLLILENLILAIPGAALGLLLAWRGIPVLVGYAQRVAAPQRLYFNMEVDGLVIGFAVLVACGSGLVFGFVPALRSSRSDLVPGMKEASPRGAARGRLRSALVVAQIAVSLLLLVGAGLMTRSLEAARRSDPGFDATHVANVALDLKLNRHDEASGRVFYRRLLSAAREDAGVETASLAAYLPLSVTGTRELPVEVDGYEPRRDEDMSFMGNIVGPDYFRALRIEMVTGREFEERDDETAEPVAIVNATLAERFWGGAPDAVGKRIRVSEGDWRTVIGVASDIKYSQINEPPRPYVYIPFFQSYRSGMILHTRGPAPVETLVEQARAQVAALDADLPVLFARPMIERTSAALIFLNFAATMLFIFGVAGMALSALGTYGLVSYTVRQSTHEIGIRMALGATSAAVVRTFLARGLKLGAIGAALGIIGALGAGRLLGGVMYGVSSTDVPSFSIALVVVLTGVILATIFPAWRAARVNPLTALRHQ